MSHCHDFTDHTLTSPNYSSLTQPSLPIHLTYLSTQHLSKMRNRYFNLSISKCELPIFFPNLAASLLFFISVRTTQPCQTDRPVVHSCSAFPPGLLFHIQSSRRPHWVYLHSLWSS